LTETIRQGNRSDEKDTWTIFDEALQFDGRIERNIEWNLLLHKLHDTIRLSSSLGRRCQPTKLQAGRNKSHHFPFRCKKKRNSLSVIDQSDGNGGNLRILSMISSSLTVTSLHPAPLSTSSNLASVSASLTVAIASFNHSSGVDRIPKASISFEYSSSATGFSKGYRESEMGGGAPGVRTGMRERVVLMVPGVVGRWMEREVNVLRRKQRLGGSS
jgi:hypothetical protein